MKADNTFIWIPSYWNSKREPLEVICENQELAWRGIVTHVEAILANCLQVFVVLRSVDTNPRDVSECDLANAELTTLVVSGQQWRSIHRRKIRTFLQYPENCRVEVEVNLKATTHRLRKYMATARKSGTQMPLPTPVLSYLLTRQKPTRKRTEEFTTSFHSHSWVAPRSEIN